MTDNLAEMVDNLPAEEDEGRATELPTTTSTTTTEEPVTEAPAEPEPLPANAIAVTNLTAWIGAHIAQVENVKNHALTVRGVDPSKTLVLSDTHPKGGEFGDNPRRRIYTMEDSDGVAVPDHAPVAMRVYNHNSFSILCQLAENYFVKCYGSKSGMTLVYCVSVDEMLIPFSRVKVDKKENRFVYPETPPTQAVTDALPRAANMENLALLYKQIKKVESNIDTNLSAVRWLLARQATVYDVAHLIQLDDAMIHIVNSTE